MWNDPPHGLLGRTGLLGRLLAIAVLNSATLRGFVTVLSAVSCGSRGCGAFRLFSFKKQFNLPHGEREIYFAFTASYSVPLISLTMEEHRLDPEAFWIHGCVFPSTDSGNHTLNSRRALKSVTFTFSFFFLATHAIFSSLKDS